MLHTVRLVPRSYLPDSITPGMLFFTDRIIQVDKAPINQEDFMQEYGYPVEFYLVDQDPNLRWSNVLATPQQVGWFDYDPEGEDFAEITVDHLNLIALEYDGWCQIDVYTDNLDDDEAHEEYVKVMPELLEGKVIIHTLDYDDDDYDEEDDDDLQWEYMNGEYEEDEDDYYEPTDEDDDTWKEN
jgi:hypothetical protein